MKALNNFLLNTNFQFLLQKTKSFDADIERNKKTAYKISIDHLIKLDVKTNNS